MDSPSARPRVRWYHYIGAVIGSPIYLFFAYLVVAWRVAPFGCLVAAVVAAFMGEWLYAASFVLGFFVFRFYNWAFTTMTAPEVDEDKAEAMRQEQLGRWRKPPKKATIPPPV